MSHNIRKDVRAGEVLLRSKPFVKCVATAIRTVVCEACLSRTRLQICPGCHYAHYCSKSCVIKDLDEHKEECEILAKNKLKPSSDLCRILLRLVLKVRNNKHQQELMPDGSYRGFDDLLSHKKDILASESRKATFEALYNELLRFLPSLSKELALKCFGRLVINSFHVLDSENEVLATALYLGASIFDHNCHPSASVSFSSFDITVRSLESKSDVELTHFRISYIDPMTKRERRRNLLLSQYYFYCECERCCDESENDLMLAVMCGGCNNRLANSMGFECNVCETKHAEENNMDNLELVQSVLDEHEGNFEAAKLCVRLMNKFRFCRENILRFQTNFVLFVHYFDMFEISREKRLWASKAHSIGLELLYGFDLYLKFPVRQWALILDQMAMLAEEEEEKKQYREKAKQMLMILQ